MSTPSCPYYPSYIPITPFGSDGQAFRFHLFFSRLRDTLPLSSESFRPFPKGFFPCCVQVMQFLASLFSPLVFSFQLLYRLLWAFWISISLEDLPCGLSSISFSSPSCCFFFLDMHTCPQPIPAKRPQSSPVSRRYQHEFQPQFR